jgi:hypothetical protein
MVWPIRGGLICDIGQAPADALPARGGQNHGGHGGIDYLIGAAALLTGLGLFA